jgi:hypothetical protein
LKNIINNKLELRIKLKINKTFIKRQRKKIINQNNKNQIGKIKYVKLEIKKLIEKKIYKRVKKIKNQKNKD